MSQEASAAPPANVAPPQIRLGSIDAYRGLVMFLMMAEVLRLSAVYRNWDATSYFKEFFWAILAHHQSHVEWTGCSLHDLIQPSFSFLVGVALPFSLANRVARGQSLSWATLHAVWRATLLTALGVFLRSMGHWQTRFTFEDTLSQIGLGYVPLFLLGLTSRRWQWVALAVILVGYWGAFALYPLPRADFDYAKVGVPETWDHHFPRDEFRAHWNKNSNLAWNFDTWFLNLFPQEPKVEKDGTKIPQVFTHNRGGYATLSFIPTLATMILGLVAGGWLKEAWPARQKLMRLGIAGLACLLGGWLLDYLGICPSVKRIWTPSWVLFSGGWCFLFLAAFYGMIDVARWQSWSFPLRVIGMNSIAAYVIAHVFFEEFIRDSLKIHLGQNLFTLYGFIPSELEPLVQGTAILTGMWLVLYWMYRRKVFLRI